MSLNNGVLNVSGGQKQTVAIAAADDVLVIKAVKAALESGVANFLLIGEEDELTRLVYETGIHKFLHSGITIVHAVDKESAVQQAIRAVNEHEADVLMKGNVPTAVLLKGVLHKEHGLRSKKVLSHVALFEIPGFEKLIFISDAAMNITPTIEQKKYIIENTVKAATALGVEYPKVALLAAVETVNPAMPACTDAAILTQMNRRGQITGCEVDGPLALDNAISLAAAKQKGISGTVAGQADILIVPDIQSGNILYKSLVYFAKASVASIIMGATAPIVLTSRSDSSESKLNSLVFALKVAKTH